jgi:hypothetical protein
MPPPSGWYKEFMAAAGVNVGSHKPTRNRPPGSPMDLANMRHNGVRSIEARCLECDHRGSINVDDQPAHLPVKSFEKRMRCKACGSRRIDVRPDWSSMPKWSPK